MPRLNVNDKNLHIPYPAVDHGDSVNHGYMDLRAHPELIDRVPELEDFPELRSFIVALNAPESRFRSLGCDKSFSSFHNEKEPSLTIKLVYMLSKVASFEKKLSLTFFLNLVKTLRVFKSFSNFLSMAIL